MRLDPADRFEPADPQPWDSRGDSGGALALRAGILADLRRVLGSANAAVSLLPGTATGAWETALCNVLHPGDRVLIARNGPFSGRLAALLRLMGCVTEIVDAPWGHPVPVAALARRLGQDAGGAIRAVIGVHVETATGTASDIAAMRRALDEAGHDALLMVDAVASFGAAAPQMDACGIDLCVAGGSRGLLGRRGVAMVAAGPRAAAAMGGPKAGAVDLRGQAMPFPLPAPLLLDLRCGLDRLKEEGLASAAARHRRLAAAARAAAAAWELDPVTVEGSACADTVTAVTLPRHVDARTVIRIARERYRATLGALPSPFEGRAFRIDHADAADEAALLALLAVTELALAEAGLRIGFGTGIAAAQGVLAPARPAAPRFGVVAA